jgi:hypothetical protein
MEKLMYIKQLSVFIENREGRLEEVLETLKAHHINIVSLSLADTAEYGLLRMIVSDPQAGREALKEGGFSSRLTDVLAVRLNHSVGQLQELLYAVCKAGINIEYMYALATGKDDACMVFKASDCEKAVDILKKDGIEVITSDDIAKL